MLAIPLRMDKWVNSDGTIIVIRIWQLPKANEERRHGLKYSLFYGRPGQRLVAYDNERGKGDHKHYGDREFPYKFNSVEQLLNDFYADIATERGET
jgi:Family of unknown function (DUF6516)